MREPNLSLALGGKKKTWAATARILSSIKIENGENTEYREINYFR